MAFSTIAGSELMPASGTRAAGGNGEQQHSYIFIQQVQPAGETKTVPYASVKLFAVDNSRQPIHLMQSQQQQSWQLSQLQPKPQETIQLSDSPTTHCPVGFGQQQQQQQPQQLFTLPAHVLIVSGLTSVTSSLPTRGPTAKINIPAEPVRDLQRNHHGRSTKKRRRTNKARVVESSIRS
jgi:hypothetical protein